MAVVSYVVDISDEIGFKSDPYIPSIILAGARTIAR